MTLKQLAPETSLESNVDSSHDAERAPAAGRRVQPVVAGALAGCILSAAFLAADVHSPARVAAALLLFCLAPGATLLSLLSRRSARLELGLVVAVSLATLTVLAEVMLALHAWYPTSATYLVAAACASVLVRQLLQRPDTGSTEKLRATRAPTLLRAFHVLPLGAAAALWGLSLQHVDLRRISGFGLLPGLPVTYYAALLLVVVGFVFAISRPALSPKLLAVYVVGLVVVLYGTTAAVYAEPRYTWMYKYLGVINYIALHGTVHRPTDIYSNWPGFFAGNAWFKDVAGIAPISYAAWAPVFFELANAAALLFVARGLTQDTRLQWTTVWIFLSANWIGQDYLAPQALGFLLVLVVFGLCIRYAPEPLDARSEVGRRWRRWLHRLAGRRADAAPQETLDQASQSLPPRAALFVGAICTLATVFSHQLSPIMLGVGLAAFMLATGRLRFSLLLALVSLETGWILLAWSYLNSHFSLFNFDLFPHPRPTGYDAARALPGVAAVADISHGLVAVVALLALVGVIRRRRSGQLNLAAVGLLIAPIPVVTFQSYGGEISLRAYLFALPWLAFFAAAACSVPLPSSRMRALCNSRFAVATLVIGIGFLFSYFGLEKINYVTQDDVAAASWYEQNAPVGSVMGYVAANFPQGVTADYSRVRIYGSSYIPQMTYVPAFRKRGLTAADLPTLVSLLRGAKARHTYFVVSPSEENFVQLYGILPSASLRNLVGLLRSSPDFHLAYRHGQAFIFQLASSHA